MSDSLQWKRGRPTKKEFQECWIATAGEYDKPNRYSIGYLSPPNTINQKHWSKKLWYIVLDIEPVKTKFKTVIQTKYRTNNGEELWTHLAVSSNKWIITTETRKREVPCE